MATVNAITTPHPEYTKALPYWSRMRDCIAGQDAIKDKGVLYLPPLNDTDVSSTGATSAAYNIYLENAQFYNATGLTYEAFIGMIFRKPIRVGEASKEEALKENPLLENVDFEGTSIQVFSRDVAEENAAIGRVGILNDSPTNTDQRERSLSEADADGLRPFMKMYIAENIINWKFAYVNGYRKLVTVVLQEEVEKDPDDAFSHETVKQYRALLIEDGKYVQRVYDDSGAELEESQANSTPILINGEVQSEIPFTCINSRSIGMDIETPPLLNIANTNLSHYKISASLGACIHMFGRITPLFYVPYQHIDQFLDQPMEYGVTKSIVIPTDAGGAKAEGGFLEPNADFTPTVNEMMRLEARMAAQGARALRPQKSGVESAETVGLDMMSELSILGSIANNTSIGLTIATSIMMSEPTLVKLNTDFLTKPIDATMVAQLHASLAAGSISLDQFIDSMVRGEAIIPEAEITTDTAFTEPEVEEPEVKEVIGEVVEDEKKEDKNVK